MGSVLITGTSTGIGLDPLSVSAGQVTESSRQCGAWNAAAPFEPSSKESSCRFPSCQMDVDSDESIAGATAAVRDQVGCLDALVNNAGIERAGSVEGLTLDDFKATMETNYFGALRTIRAWLPEMRRRRSGCIINITSVAGKIACSPLAPYAASKFALEALSEALAQEVRPFGVRVAIVEPGIIDTGMAQRIEGIDGCGIPPRSAASATCSPRLSTIRHRRRWSWPSIRDIIESGTQTLRHPVGPDAEGFLAWRASLTDDQWIEWGALPDDAGDERVGSDFGLDARSKRGLVATAAQGIRGVV